MAASLVLLDANADANDAARAAAVDEEEGLVWEVRWLIVLNWLSFGPCRDPKWACMLRSSSLD